AIGSPTSFTPSSVRGVSYVMRETAINFPTSLSAEEKQLKEMFEKLKNIRRTIAAATRGTTNPSSSDQLKIERRNAKRSLQQAEEATEEVKRKVMSGAINLKKVDEKSTFKRTKVIPKRRGSESAKLRLDTSDTGNSSGNELLSPSTISLSSPPFSLRFESREQPQVNKGPTLYVRGFDLVADSLQKAFSKHGAVTRLFVEERQKSAFITFSTTEEAEAALKNMDGYMLNGITLHVSFARRQNQNTRSPRECINSRGGSREEGSFLYANPRGRGGDGTSWEQRRFDSSSGTDKSQHGGGSFRYFDGGDRRTRQKFSSRSPSADRRSSRSRSQDRRSSRSPSGDEKVSQQKCQSRSSNGNDKVSLGQYNFHSVTKDCGHLRGRLRENDKKLCQKRSSTSPCGDRRSSCSPSQDRRSSHSTDNEEKISSQQWHRRSSSKGERTSRGQPQFRFCRGSSRLAQGCGGVRNHERRSWQKPHQCSSSKDRRLSRSLSQDRRSSCSPSGDEKTPEQQCTSNPPHGDEMFSRRQHSLRFMRAGGKPSRPRGIFRGNNRRSWQKQISRSPSADRRSSRSLSQDRRSSCSPNRDEKTAQKQRLLQSPSGNDRSSRRKRNCPFGRDGERSRGYGGFRGSERRLWQKRSPYFPNANRRSSHSPNQDRGSSRSLSQDRRSSRSLSGDEGTSQHLLPRPHSVEGKNGSRSSKGNGSSPRGQLSFSSSKGDEGAPLSPPPSVTPAALAAWNSAGIFPFFYSFFVCHPQKNGPLLNVICSLIKFE
uniref:Negative elongation factor E n=1 Tax=Parascaris univalens TaxID=6257 RepID=A0A915CGB3_PARUN